MPAYYHVSEGLGSLFFPVKRSGPALNKETAMKDKLIVDARGLACPQPVLETKKVLDQALSSHFKVLVDNDAARENVSRFAMSRGCQVVVRDEGSGCHELTITGEGTPPDPATPEELPSCALPEAAAPPKCVVYIGTNCVGRGDDALGAKLMRGFLRTWIDAPVLPWRIVFMNSGVKLATVDEEAVDALGMLAQKGVEILSCGTCLQHFGLEKELKVGKVTNMYEVIEPLNAATKVISPD
jgi:selenium metabolism protein YedF